MTVLGDYLKVGDIKDAVAVALGRGAEAKAEDAQMVPDTMATVLGAIVAQLERVARQLAALTERLDSLDERLAAHEPRMQEAADSGPHA